MEMAADPQPSSACFTYGTSSQIPAFSWGPGRAEDPRKRSGNRPRTIRFIRIRNHSNLQKLTERDCQDDDTDGDQDDPKQIAIGNASRGKITLRLTRPLGQLGKVFIAQLTDGLIHFLIVKVGGQLSDEDLAKLAQRSRQAQSDFAAGRISDRDLLWIILIAIGIIFLAVALR